MSKKLYWGLGVLVLLLCTAFVWMTIHNRAEIRQLKQDAAKLAQEQPGTEQPVADNRPPPPGKTFEGGGHWHNGEWHDAPHTVNSQEPNIQDTISNLGDMLVNENYVPIDDLTNHYVNLHYEKYPNCKEHQAVLTDAEKRARWVLDYRVYSSKEKDLDIESKAIDDEIKEIVGDNINDYYKRISSLSADKKKALETKVKALYNRAIKLDEKYEALSKTEPIYPEGLHTH